MTTPDLTCAPAQSRPRPRIATSDLGALGAAISLVLLMGVPALVAPPSQVQENDWHGNAAPHAITAR